MSKSRKSQKHEDAVKELRPGQSIELLKHLGILTSNGTLNADSRRKLKQVNHLISFIEPVIKSQPSPVILDFGAGKSYLGFLIYDLILKSANKGEIQAVEVRPKLLEKSQKIATNLGFTRMSFASNLEEFSTPPDIVTALHACDTATDVALQFAVKSKAKSVFLIPCCQAEMASALKSSKGPLRALWDAPLHRREFGSHLTNVIRVLKLQAAGYRVSVTELIGWEHSLKNELIVAEKISEGYPPANDALLKLIEEFELEDKQLYCLEIPSSNSA